MRLFWRHSQATALAFVHPGMSRDEVIRKVAFQRRHLIMYETSY